jgi:hypothetical protein
LDQKCSGPAQRRLEQYQDGHECRQGITVATVTTTTLIRSRRDRITRRLVPVSARRCRNHSETKPRREKQGPILLEDPFDLVARDGQ